MSALLNDLREAGTVLHDEAADRIEALEGALRPIFNELNKAGVRFRGNSTAHAAMKRARALLTPKGTDQ